MTTTYTPSIYTLPQTPLPSNSHPSSTLTEQYETEQLISELFAFLPPPSASSAFQLTSGGSEDSPTGLRKNEHTQFLASTFFRLPGKFVSLDASRPWLIFWTVHSLDLLGVALDQETKNRTVSTLSRFLSPLGGFAGGPANSQIPHLLPTYAAVSALAVTGNTGPEGGWTQLAAARQATYNFFMRCKRPDGGFVVCQGGEVDVRGTYCLLVVATLLDLLTPELLHNVDQFIAACQTYEGGFACSSVPFATASASSPKSEFMRAPIAEAHGGYTSCSLNSYFLLSSIPLPDFPKPIDVQGALRWSVLQQGEAIEGGGFRGRTNKLVDGCYSWWVGGGFPVLEELAKGEWTRRTEGERHKVEIVAEDDEKEDDWEDVALSPPLFNRVALQEFTLIAAQQEAGGSGGLRDKPGKRPDLYHTANNLSGLSTAQHHMSHSSTLIARNRDKFDSSKGLPAVKPTTPDGGWEDEDERQRVRKEVWSSALAWVEDEGRELVLGGKGNRVNTTTPVFNILGLRLKPFINYFYCQDQA